MNTKTEVVEQRIKPTLIRRRKKIEAPTEEISEAIAQPKAIDVAEVAKSLTEEQIKPRPDELPAQASTKEAPRQEKQLQAQAPQASARAPEAQYSATHITVDGLKLTKPSDAERKIGVVGYIDLGGGPISPPVNGTEKEKEDWKERMKKGPKRKKSREELEMEAIQRAGGLKHYAGAIDDEASFEVKETPSEEASIDYSAGERIFQPVPSTRKKKSQRREFKKTQLTERKAIKKIIRIEDGISVGGLSQALGVKANEIIKKLMGLNLMTTVNHTIDVETASLISSEYGFSVEHTAFKEEDVLVEPEAKVSIENQVHRAPVVTVMGHVDHGKTSILDCIRKSNVADGEAGGITQHIGAYEVTHPKGTITFLDTPGHAAFTMMRARGAEATDIVILVVAADDGIMPQTIEAINHAKAAEVPIVVAINKIDKSNAQPDRVKQSLTEYGLVPEEWGGDVICVPTSAKTGKGIDQLLEMVLLQSEVLELKADPLMRVKGIVIEARLDKGRGPVATVLIQEGTLTNGQYVVCGTFEGKVRAMFDALGKSVTEAGPSKPIEILGLSGVPLAGDEMIGVADDKGARLVASERRQKERMSQLTKPIHVSLEDLGAQLAVSDTKELRVVLKADVQGSTEAVSDALTSLSTDTVKLTVLHSGVGGIIESDIMLATASNAIVLGFNVQPDGKAKEAAEREGIEIRSYRIIYEMLDEVKKAMEGLLAPEEKEVYLGRAEVKAVYNISKIGTIAGCQVSSGKILRNAQARLLRDQVVVFEGKIASLKRFKDDAREVIEGYECGIGIENFNDIKPGDIIEAYNIERKAARL